MGALHHDRADERRWGAETQPYRQSVLMTVERDVGRIPEETREALASEGGQQARLLEGESVSRRRLLSGRPRATTRGTRTRKDSHAVPTPAPEGLRACRPGVFAVTILKGESLVPHTRFRFDRVFLSVELLPYADVQCTSAVRGPEFTWPMPMNFTHDDQAKTGLIFRIQVVSESPIGGQELLGVSYAPLEGALDAPGAVASQWVRVDPAVLISCHSSQDECVGARLFVSICFHPMVSKGPTVHRLLHSLSHTDGDSGADDARVQSMRGMFHRIFGRRRKEIPIDHATFENRGLRRAKGTFSFALRDMHLCGSQCSRVDGHTVISLPDFAPVLLIRFDDYETELRVGPGECKDMTFEHEWPVYSSFSELKIEIFRPISARPGSAYRNILADGSPAVRVCGFSLSCFEIQEYAAASFTVDPPVEVLGPGGSRPARGFRWFVLHEGEEELGFVQIRANYCEDLLAILDAEECSDLSYVPQDERTFDPAIIQRNFERIDELFKASQALKGYWDDTLDWKYPVRTVFAWSWINFCVFLAPAGHLPLVFGIFILTFLTCTLYFYTRGDTHRRWIEHVPGSSRQKLFRPIATLRVAPLRGSSILSAHQTIEYPDTFVRICYEPNFKRIPVRQIAETARVRRSQNPDWSIVGRDANPVELLKLDSIHVREAFRQFSKAAQTRMDVVQPWPRQDGRRDSNGYMFSFLQPVAVSTTSGQESLISWDQTPGVIRFDVIQESDSDYKLLVGRVRYPIKLLVSNLERGGEQSEVEVALPLVSPSRSTTKPGQDSKMEVSNQGTSILTVRMQLILPNPADKKRVTLRDTLASEALYEVTEMEVERELSWVEKYHKAKDVAKNIQQTLGSFCSTLERLKNLFLWVQPRKTMLVYIFTAVACFLFYIVPLKYLILYVTSKAFTRRFHKIVDNDAERFRNLLVSIPSDLDMKRIYQTQNRQYLRAKEYSEAHARLQAKWSGSVFRQTYIQGWQERYCALRGSRLEFWHSIADAKAGLPPKSIFTVSNAIGACEKTETDGIPQGIYPLVVFEIAKSHFSLLSRGKRRIICMKTQEEFISFVEAVQRAGEPLSPTPGANLN